MTTMETVKNEVKTSNEKKNIKTQQPDIDLGFSTTSANLLLDSHMPQNFDISLDSLRRGGTDDFLQKSPSHAIKHSMNGFEKDYVNIVDYIVRITHKIWEEKDIGYIYDTYSHDCKVWDDFGLQYGRDKIVADTIHTTNAFPDIRLVADEVIWAGDDKVGFHTSHRTKIIGTNTGYSKYGAPTGRPIKLWCIANCVARNNEIFDEYVNYDTSGLIQQLGMNLFEVAEKLSNDTRADSLPNDFLASDPVRLNGQNKPERIEIPSQPESELRNFAESVFNNIWNRRDLSVMEKVYAENVGYVGSTDRVFKGIGQLRSFNLSILAMFPNLALNIDEVYWMGNSKEGIAMSVRWSATGRHLGFGVYGKPSGKEVQFRGITQWDIRDGKIQNEWTLFNELGVLMQIFKKDERVTGKCE